MGNVIRGMQQRWPYGHTHGPRPGPWIEPHMGYDIPTRSYTPSPPMMDRTPSPPLLPPHSNLMWVPPPAFVPPVLTEPELPTGADEGGFAEERPTPRWGPRSPDKFIPRGPMRPEQWVVLAEGGVGYRLSPSFNDRIPGEQEPCDAVVTGMRIKGIDGQDYLRVKSGYFLPTRDKSGNAAVLRKVEPDIALNDALSSMLSSP